MPRESHLRTLKKLTGVVTSTGMDRTAVVSVARVKVHPKTRKFLHHITKYFCHDRHEVCGVGDRVHIKPCQQLSKKKFWTVIDILARHPQLSGEPFPMSRLKLPLAEYPAILQKQAEQARAEEAAAAAGAGAGVEAAVAGAAQLR